MNRIQISQKSGKISLEEQFSKAGAIYELSGELDMANATVKVPEKCVLKFEEGTKISNGTLVLNNTVFEGAKHCIATRVSGVQYELDTDNFDLTGTNKVAIMQSIVNTATCVQMHGRFEDVFNNIYYCEWRYRET